MTTGRGLGSFELEAVSKPHLRPEGCVAARFKMLTYLHVCCAFSSGCALLSGPIRGFETTSNRSHLKKVFSPEPGAEPSSQVLDILECACLRLGPALISDKDPNFETASNRILRWPLGNLAWLLDKLGKICFLKATKSPIEPFYG